MYHYLVDTKMIQNDICLYFSNISRKGIALKLARAHIINGQQPWPMCSIHEQYPNALCIYKYDAMFTQETTQTR